MSDISDKPGSDTPFVFSRAHDNMLMDSSATPSKLPHDLQGKYRRRMMRLMPITHKSKDSSLAAPRREWDFDSTQISRAKDPQNITVSVNPGYNNANNDPNYDSNCHNCKFGARHIHAYVSPEAVSSIIRPPNPGFNSDPIYTEASKNYFNYTDQLAEQIEQYNSDLEFAQTKMKEGDIDVEFPKKPELPAEAKAIRAPTEKGQLKKDRRESALIGMKREKAAAKGLLRIGERPKKQKDSGIEYGFLTDEEIAARRADEEIKKDSNVFSGSQQLLVQRQPAVPAGETSVVSDARTILRKREAFQKANNARIRAGNKPYGSHEEWEAEEGPFTG